MVWAESEDAAKRPGMHRQSLPPTKVDLAQNISSVKVEEARFRTTGIIL